MYLILTALAVCAAEYAARHLPYPRFIPILSVCLVAQFVVLHQPYGTTSATIAVSVTSFYLIASYFPNAWSVAYFGGLIVGTALIALLSAVGIESALVLLAFPATGTLCAAAFGLVRARESGTEPTESENAEVEQ